MDAQKEAEKAAEPVPEPAPEQREAPQAEGGSQEVAPPQ